MYFWPSAQCWLKNAWLAMYASNCFVFGSPFSDFSPFAPRQPARKPMPGARS